LKFFNIAVDFMAIILELIEYLTSKVINNLFWSFLLTLMPNLQIFYRQVATSTSKMSLC